MFGQLQNKFNKIFKTIRGHGKISENNISDAIRQIRIALLESDVNFKVVSKFISNVKEKSLGTKVFESVTPGQQFIKLVLDELIHFLESDDSKLSLKKSSFSVIVLAGLQGAGKTTTAAKIAGFLKREFNKHSLLVGLDLQRPAATKQLKVLAESNNIDFYIEENAKDPLTVLKNSFNHAKSIKTNVVILDTAGRLHIDDTLINELKDIIDLSSPSEILYVADGMTGQDAVNSSKIFKDNCNITGCVLTKMDADSGGGAALSIREVTGIPIKFIANGEKQSDLELFNPERIARRILGLGDVIGFVEQASKSIDENVIKNVEEKLKNDSFDFNDFKNQLSQMNNMGGLTKMMDFLPNIKNKSKLNLNDDQLIATKAIIDSMTKYERKNPNIINGSRRQRIAKGSGTTMQKVNQLLKQFKQMKLLMKKIKNKKFNKLPFSI